MQRVIWGKGAEAPFFDGKERSFVRGFSFYRNCIILFLDNLIIKMIFYTNKKLHTLRVNDIL